MSAEIRQRRLGRRNRQLSAAVPSATLATSMRLRMVPVTLLLAASVPAAAQVTVNPKALEPPGQPGAQQTAPRKPAAAPHAEQQQAGRDRHGRARQQNAAKPPKPTQSAAKPAGPSSPPPTHSLVRAPPPVPPAPPPVPVLAPEQPAPPAHIAPPAEPVPVVAGAVGEALPIPGGLRLTFGSGSADLNPETDAALQKLAHRTATDSEAIVTVKAYARGSADDPSTPRRLSLSRALVARSVLLSEGIGSTRIYVRALGESDEPAPPDRVDVTVAPGNPARASKPPR